ncbi:SDR family NAD(P)-dependent oxidoreductase, partial [Streptomyces boncukensis]
MAAESEPIPTEEWTRERVVIPRTAVRAFADASGDRSPVHTDDSYARHTPFGEPVAHGVLCALIALAGVAERADRHPARITVRFLGAVLPDRPCRREIAEDTPERAVVRLVDGDRRLLEVTAAFRPGPAPVPAPMPGAGPGTGEPGGPTGRHEARDLGPRELQDLAARPLALAPYVPDTAALNRLAATLGLPERGLGSAELAVLGWASYLVGMEAPGRRALLSRLTVDFTDATDEPDGAPGSAPDGSARPEQPFRAAAGVAEFDPATRLVRVTGSAGPGARTARVDATAFLRAACEPPSAAEVERLSPDGEPLRGRTALVVGGSRGLGAALVQALVVRGCTVYLGFAHSRAAAEAVRAALGPRGGRVRLLQGDAADPGWCARVRDRVRAEQGRLDFLLLSAAPPLHPLGLHPDTGSRAAEHLRHGLALARGPLAACAADVAERGGWVVAVSSSAVARPPAGWSHYVTAKAALEGLVRAVPSEHPAARVLVVRPPRLLTTYADAPALDGSATRVEPVAVGVVRHLTSEARPGEVTTVEEFTAPETDPHPDPPDPVEGTGGTDGADGTDGTDGAGGGDDGAALVVSATFTVDSLRAPLAALAQRLGLGLDVRLAPYGQIFQELLDGGSGFHRNPRGCDVALVRLEDWPPGDEGERAVDDFTDAAASAAARLRVPLLVCVCPPSPLVTGDPERAREHAALEARLAEGLRRADGVHVRSSGEWSGGLPVPDHHDPAREELAHMPYTAEAYHALAAGVARAAHGLLAPPYKVLVLDCDNTLWRGQAAEDGPRGVAVEPGHRRLQEWAAGLRDRGVLLCLCSKNEERDVDAVFRERAAELPLRAEHLAARRIGWEPKAEALRSLARELDVGTDSLVFLDDNPVETAAVREALPEVLALTVPQDPDALPDFVDRIWAFDSPGTTTEEDRRRAAGYRERRARDRFRSTTATFAEFIAGLRLRVDVHEPRPDQLPRVAQLTHRTNQFTVAPLRRQLGEVRALLEGGARCWVAEVSDRFGEYGLVAAALGRREGDTLRLDTFLASCRVLGRGVEHAFLSRIGRDAVADGVRTVELAYLRTERNTPVRRFLEEVATPDAAPAENGTVTYRLSAESAAAVAFAPERALPDADRAEGGTTGGTDESGSAEDGGARSAPARNAALVALAEQITGAAALRAWLEGSARLRSAPEPGPDAASGAEGAMGALRDVLARALDVPGADLHPGVTLESLRLSSLDVVEVTVALEKQFGALHKTLFFEHRTLGEVAAFLAAQHGSRAADAGDADGASGEPSVAPAASAAVRPPAAPAAPRPEPSPTSGAFATCGAGGASGAS